MTGTQIPAVTRRSAKFDAALMLNRDAGDRPQSALERGRNGRAIAVLRAPLLAAFSDETKTPLATLVAGDGVEEILLAKVRPKNVGEIELCVGQTVEQEVRDAPFAAGADDQI